MKKITVLFSAILIVFCMSASVFADAITYSSAEGSFATKFWKEKYFGGGDGKVGNVLMAKGEAFSFQYAVLTEIIPGKVPDLNDGETDGYVTTYQGGKLVLNPSGPWSKRYVLKNVTATNKSSKDDDGYLFFTLEFSGTDQKTGALVEVTATYHAGANNYRRQVDEEGKPVFQRGINFDASVTITNP